MKIEIPDHEVKAIVDILRIWNNLKEKEKRDGRAPMDIFSVEDGFGNYQWLLEEIASQYKPSVN